MIKKEYYTLTGSSGRLMPADLTFDDTNPQAPVIIFAHGFKGFKDWGAYNLVADYFAGQGYRFLKFNFSHNGTTPDHLVDFADMIAFSENTFTKELDDLAVMIDFACNGSAMPPAKSVCLMGHSMGGGISIIKAAEDKRVNRLITMASIGAFRTLWSADEEQQWRMQGIKYFENQRLGIQMPVKASLLDDLDRNPVRLNILAKAAELTQPWLIIHGEEDETIPVKQAYQLQSVHPGAELVIVKNADHVFNVPHPYPSKTLTVELQEFCDAAAQFLNN